MHFKIFAVFERAFALSFIYALKLCTEAFCVFGPHILAVLSKFEFRELLVGIAAIVIQICFVVTIPEILAKVKIFLKVHKYLLGLWVWVNCWFCHFIYLSERLLDYVSVHFQHGLILTPFNSGVNCFLLLH